MPGALVSRYSLTDTPRSIENEQSGGLNLAELVIPEEVRRKAPRAPTLTTERIVRHVVAANQPEAATDAFRAAVRYLPHSPSAYLTLANHLSSEGRTAEALEVLQPAARLTDDATVRRRLDELRGQLQAAGKRRP